jgi:hypothetical protein
MPCPYGFGCANPFAPELITLFAGIINTFGSFRAKQVSVSLKLKQFLWSQEMLRFIALILIIIILVIILVRLL